MSDVPELVKAFDARNLTFKARASAPKRATKGCKTPIVAQKPGSRMGLRCFYYFVRNSLVALLEALCARIFFFNS